MTSGEGVEASLVTGEAAGHTTARFKGCEWEESVGGMVLILGCRGGGVEKRGCRPSRGGVSTYFILYS